jgi:hypothetical protein
LAFAAPHTSPLADETRQTLRIGMSCAGHA